jgi:hypothetical protein
LEARALAALPAASSLLSPNVFVSLLAAAGRMTAGTVLACWEHPNTPKLSRAIGTATIIFMVNSEDRKKKKIFQADDYKASRKSPAVS